MKKLMLFFVLAGFAFASVAQVDMVKKLLKTGNNQERSIVSTKFHRHSERNGGFVRYEEFDVPEIKVADALIGSAKVRRYLDFHTDKETCFLIISIGKDKNTEYVAIEDLLKVREALVSLRQKCKSDSVAQRSVKCFYVTDDGFKVGYNTKKDKVTWFFTAGGVEYKFGKGYDFSQAISGIEKMLAESPIAQE